jgi:pSer/pThr/pTyr-binding forkhead associated (FHA) protein
MIVSCGGCGKNYRFDEAKLHGRSSATLRCPGCQGTITVTAPTAVGDRTTRLDSDANQLPTSGKVPSTDLAMPLSRRISLAILQGKDSGRIFPVERPSVVIGRGDADIILNDSEISRQHACIEVHGTKVVLRDLGSTNGTFLNEVKITQSEIENRSEFRVGGTRLMLIVTETEQDLEPVG